MFLTYNRALAEYIKKLFVELDCSELRKMISIVKGFCMIVYMASWFNLDTDKQHQDKIEKFTKEKFNKTLDEFRKISKKHEF